MSLKLGLAVGLVSVLIVACTPVATPFAPEVTELPRQEMAVVGSATPVPPSATALPSPRTATPTAAMIRALPEPTSTDVIVQRRGGICRSQYFKDNNAGDSQLETGMGGFSCLVEGSVAHPV